MDISIEPMNRGTLAAVATMERRCFADPWSLEALESELSNLLAVFYVARFGGEPVGYAGMHHVVDEGYITNVAVDPDYRRKGVARTLVEALLRYGRENKLWMVTLEVRRSNAGAIALYKGLGFREVGVRRGYYRHPIEDALLMTAEL